ncbi:MAG: ABC transporter substrate-binding protein [Bacilli bacterium]|nr:ABC transporter substrate-binding protein [Bacilli bacterium]
MKSKKLLLTALTSLAFASGLTACGGGKADFKIGILQPVEHAALDAAQNGFKEGVKEKLGDKTVEFNYLNAMASDANMSLYASDLVDANDLNLGIGTGAALALKSASVTKGSTKPVLFTAVTDPVDAKLVSDKNAPEGFITGSSDMNPVVDQINLIQEVMPTVSKIGILYTQSEVNSKVQSDMAEAKITELGLTPVIRTCTNSADITSAAQALVDDGVQAIYIPTDNNIAANMGAVKTPANAAHVLVMCGEEGMIKSGGHLTLSINYFDLGKQAGIMAADILLKNKTIKETPVKYMTSAECTYVLSSKNLEAAQITIPDSVKTAHSWSDVDA